MEPKINLKSLMEIRNHSENGICTKNPINRESLFTKLIVLCFTIVVSAGVWSQKSAVIQNVWVDYDVYNNYQKGMKIYIDFTVNNMLDRQGSCVAWFYFSDGTVLKDFNNQYRTTDGQVSVSGKFRPIYTSTKFTDFEIFMPYDELHLNEGYYNLKFYLGIFDNNNKLMTTSEYQYFEITK